MNELWKAPSLEKTSVVKNRASAVKVCVRRLKVLADETRLLVLRITMGSPKTVSQINQQVQIDQSLLSHHLKVLRDAGLVFSVRQGKSVLYQTSPDIIFKSQESSINLGCCKLTFNEPSKGIP